MYVYRTFREIWKCACGLFYESERQCLLTLDCVAVCLVLRHFALQPSTNTEVAYIVSTRTPRCDPALSVHPLTFPPPLSLTLQMFDTKSSLISAIDYDDPSIFFFVQHTHTFFQVGEKSMTKLFRNVFLKVSTSVKSGASLLHPLRDTAIYIWSKWFKGECLSLYYVCLCIGVCMCVCFVTYIHYTDFFHNHKTYPKIKEYYSITFSIIYLIWIPIDLD